jgi:hypothetical protein
LRQNVHIDFDCKGQRDRQSPEECGKGGGRMSTRIGSRDTGKRKRMSGCRGERRRKNKNRKSKHSSFSLLFVLGLEFDGQRTNKTLTTASWLGREGRKRRLNDAA